MIAWLSGHVRELDPSGIAILDVNGVGYEVFVSMQTLCKLQQGEKAAFHIHTHVREDQITLFGFDSQRERSIFRKLTSVSGIGARMAINLLSGMSVDELLTAIDSSDDTAIARTPGIGKKTAQRLILELRGKLVDEEETAVSPAATLNADVRSALANLGYKPAQIDMVLKQVNDQNGSFEEMFKAALKALA
ncbi:MAG TPA: Holliday junction branch migration protein RuvA [Mariprofundaceae bacterium]|nr:Holliday junction branch migration protein RuvA [Mariprofundaceae bacterium]